MEINWNVRASLTRSTQKFFSVKALFQLRKPTYQEEQPLPVPDLAKEIE